MRYTFTVTLVREVEDGTRIGHCGFRIAKQNPEPVVAMPRHVDGITPLESMVVEGTRMGDTNAFRVHLAGAAHARPAL
jgi:hypothetical protein